MDSFETIKKVLTYPVHIRFFQFQVYPGHSVPLWVFLLFAVFSLVLWQQRWMTGEKREADLLDQAMVAEGVSEDSVRVIGTVTDFWHEKKGVQNYFVIDMRWRDPSGKTHNGVSKFTSTKFGKSDLNLKIDQKVALKLNPNFTATAYISLRKNNEAIEIIWRAR